METINPTACTECPRVANSINGRYCTILDIYVEYRTIPPCQKTIST